MLVDVVDVIDVVEMVDIIAVALILLLGLCLALAARKSLGICTAAIRRGMRHRHQCSTSID
jgi:hypothetical protein